MDTNASPPSVPHELPVQLTSFIGREREIDALRGTLRSTRLLTLTGAGGSGKTRLALEVSAQVAAGYPEGVAWIELASLGDGELVPQHIATALGLRDDAARPPVDLLMHALRNRNALLILDNCEHLADACAALADTLLRGCARLTILATSREAIGVAGERAWLVPPLSLPAEDDDASADRLLDFEAVQLFVARAQDVAPAFALTDQNAAAIVQICRRLDGLPLAIELAGARVRVLAPEQIAERLDNAFALLSTGSRTALPRQRTLRATIDWSYQLLSDAEKLLLQRLSVFAGGFTLDAAETVCADQRLPAGEVLDVLTRLVDRSLVVMREHNDSARYHLLETVRQYAAERIEASDEAADARRRHAAFFVSFAESAEPFLFAGAARADWMKLLDHDVDNLRAAADWCLNSGEDGEAALRLLAAIHWYWFARGRFTEARSRLEAAVQQATAAAPLVRAKARTALANIAVWQGDRASVPVLLGDALDSLRGSDERPLLSYALVPLGWARLGDDPHEAFAILQEAISLSRTDRPNILTAVALYWTGFAAQALGHEDQARDALDEAIRIGRGLDHRPGIAHPLNGRGGVAILQGDYDMAIACLAEALLIHEQTGDAWGMITAIEGLARVARDTGADEWAIRLTGAAAAIRGRVGLPLHGGEQSEYARLVAELRTDVDDARFDTAHAAGQELAIARIVEQARARFGSPAGSPASLPASVIHVAAGEPPGQPVSARRGGDAAALRVLALGPLIIERDGEPLAADAWPYARPRELLLYLLSHPDGRTREQLGVAFWPESSAAQVKNSFHVTLHHLRKALGHADWIVYENERYRISPQLTVEFDAALFEQQMTAALRDARAGTGSIDALRDAIALYRGDFLADESAGDWHFVPRDRLRMLCVDGLGALGELLGQAGRFAEAVDVFQRVVIMEDLREDAHRRLMQFLAQGGERGRALRHYERLVALLRDELDAEPEAETVALFDSIRKGESA
jgi:predicted ATPase/DNA-binding SARP family transcriptional activator